MKRAKLSKGDINFINAMCIIASVGMILVQFIDSKNTYDETMDPITRRACELIPEEYAKASEIVSNTIYIKDNLGIMWYVFCHETQGYYYLPIECKVLDYNYYSFVAGYEATELVDDIAYIPWSEGYLFIVNQKNCTSVTYDRVSGSQYTEAIEKYPYVFYSYTLSGCSFQDANGNLLI